MKLLRYYLHKIKGSKFLDFVDQGLGIEARACRFKKYWQPHLDKSRAFQTQTLINLTPQDHVTVLGAGRLYDVALETLQIAKLHLVDADPECLRIWNKLDSQVSWELTDISCRLESWTSALKTFLKSRVDLRVEDLSEFLEELNSEPLKIDWVFPKTNYVVSLNLLSQLGIYWRDRVHQLVAARGLDSSAPQIKNAVDKMSLTLEREHLDLLKLSKANKVILISDDEFHYYKELKSPRQIEKALMLGEKIEIEGYQITQSDSWEWHLVPKGYEHKDYGEIHRVKAYEFVKKD